MTKEIDISKVRRTYRNAAKKDYDVPPFVAAEAIMMNVSEEWRNSILDSPENE